MVIRSIGENLFLSQEKTVGNIRCCPRERETSAVRAATAREQLQGGRLAITDTVVSCFEEQANSILSPAK